jgi:hypothetical protein
MSAGPDLETRVANRKRELISELVEHKKNSSRARAAGAIDQIKDRLAELTDILKAGVGPRVDLKLAQWMAK